MDIKKYIENNLIKIKVNPNVKKTELKEENDKLKLYLKAVPEKDKANKELIKFFKKQFGLKVEIKSGRRNQDKVLSILD